MWSTQGMVASASLPLMNEPKDFPGLLYSVFSPEAFYFWGGGLTAVSGDRFLVSLSGMV